MHRSHFASLINFVAMEICIVFIIIFFIIKGINSIIINIFSLL